MSVVKGGLFLRCQEWGGALTLCSPPLQPGREDKGMDDRWEALDSRLRVRHRRSFSSTHCALSRIDCELTASSGG